MPTAEHETPIALAKLDPDLVAWLLASVFGVKVPEYHHARAHATHIKVLVQRTYHADGMVLFCDEEDRPLLAGVLEVQRGRDFTKRRTWKLYAAQLEAELDVDVALMVFCPDAALARWYRDLLESDGPSVLLHPFLLTPDDVPLVTDVEQAQANPALTILSAICHGSHADADEMFPALMAALRALSPHKAILYDDIVLAGLPEAIRTRWETFMAIPSDYRFRSGLYRRVAAEAEERGEARGEARGETRGEARGESHALLTVLKARGVPVPLEIGEQILACTDREKLDVWLRRAATATTVEDVIRD